MTPSMTLHGPLHYMAPVFYMVHLWSRTWSLCGTRSSLVSLDSAQRVDAKPHVICQKSPSGSKSIADQYWLRPPKSTANYYPETYSNMVMCGTVAIASKRRCQRTPLTLTRYATGKIFFILLLDWWTILSHLCCVRQQHVQGGRPLPLMVQYRRTTLGWIREKYGCSTEDRP